MIHAKTLVVDGVWVVLGSTNFDSRSFRINDEVNLAAMDPDFACESMRISRKTSPRAARSRSSNGRTGPTSNGLRNGSDESSSGNSRRY